MTQHTNRSENSNPLWLIRSLPVLIVLVLLLAGLSYTVYVMPDLPIDLTVARAVQGFNFPGYEQLLIASGLPGYPPQVYAEFVAIVVILFLIGQRWEAVSFAFGTVGIGAVGLALKLLIDRPRPSPELIHVLNPQLDGGKFSYTAGHVQSYVVMLGFIAFLILSQTDRRAWQNLLLVIIGVMIVLIGVSRVYSGEHWFTDVVGGYLLGLIWLGVTIRFYEWGKGRFTQGIQNHGIRKETTQKVRKAATSDARQT